LADPIPRNASSHLDQLILKEAADEPRTECFYSHAACRGRGEVTDGAVVDPPFVWHGSVHTRHLTVDRAVLDRSRRNDLVPVFTVESFVSNPCPQGLSEPKHHVVTRSRRFSDGTEVDSAKCDIRSERLRQ